MFYPVATKLVSVLVSYKVQVTRRAASCKRKEKLTAETEEKLNKSKQFYDELNQSISSEIVKSSTLEVVTEATMQPLLQLYASTSTCAFSEDFTLSNLMSLAFLSNPLMFSVITSILSFSWSMTTYCVYTKNGALGIQSNLKGRFLLFGYFLVYITSRMFILIISAHQVFGGFELFLAFVFAHVILMSVIHYAHLLCMKVDRSCFSLECWIECLINSVGSILIPNNIKFPTTNGNEINWRYHEPTSLRYLLMHSIFLLENIALITLSIMKSDGNLIYWESVRYWNLNKSSTAEFENPNNSFIKMFPYWTMGMFFLAMVLKFLYYQSHAWPIKANCFTLKFFCPCWDEQNDVEASENKENEQGRSC